MADYSAALVVTAIIAGFTTFWVVEEIYRDPIERQMEACKSACRGGTFSRNVIQHFSIDVNGNPICECPMECIPVSEEKVIP